MPTFPHIGLRYRVASDPRITPQTARAASRAELLHTSNHHYLYGNTTFISVRTGERGYPISDFGEGGLGFSRAQHGKGRLLAVLETPPLPHCPGVRWDARAHSVRTIE